MAVTERTLALPRQGYGPEPRTTNEILLLVGAQVQAALPSGWTASISTGVDSDEPTRRELQIAAGGREAVTFVAEIKRTVTRSDVLAIDSDVEMEQLLVVSRYLTPQVQAALRAREISYADATGNIFLATTDPLILVSDRGATADPWRGPGRPATNLKGLPAAKLVRALVDYAPPYPVPRLAEAAGASLGAAYRLVEYLTNEGLLTRSVRGPVTDVDWPELLVRWTSEARHLDASTTHRFLEPRGLDTLMDNLRKVPAEQQYALSGSSAAQPYAAYAEPRLALLYAEDPTALATVLGLRPVDAGANVMVASPRSPVVFERTSDRQGVTMVAPSQAVSDLLGGPGRNPAEGNYLLDWMRANVDDWRLQLDR